MQFVFHDTNYKIQMILQDKKVRVEDKFNENAEKSLEVDSILSLGI